MGVWHAAAPVLVLQSYDCRRLALAQLEAGFVFLHFSQNPLWGFALVAMYEISIDKYAEHRLKLLAAMPFFEFLLFALLINYFPFFFCWGMFAVASLHT